VKCCLQGGQRQTKQTKDTGVALCCGVCCMPGNTATATAKLLSQLSQPQHPCITARIQASHCSCCHGMAARIGDWCGSQGWVTCSACLRHLQHHCSASAGASGTAAELTQCSQPQVCTGSFGSKTFTHPPHTHILLPPPNIGEKLTQCPHV
jgi:hypothetical protein